LCPKEQMPASWRRAMGCAYVRSRLFSACGSCNRLYGTRSVEKDRWLERPHRPSRAIDARRIGPWGPRLWLSSLLRSQWATWCTRPLMIGCKGPPDRRSVTRSAPDPALDTSWRVSACGGKDRTARRTPAQSQPLRRSQSRSSTASRQRAGPPRDGTFSEEACQRVCLGLGRVRRQSRPDFP
jgi:hypothetical protein